MKYVRKLNPNKLSVEFRKGVTVVQPILCRKYTLTHSDLTADLFLTIALEYAYDMINEIRDEVLAEWRTSNGSLFLYVYVFVDGQQEADLTAVRDAIFRRELPLALEAIRYGDRVFFYAHPELDRVPIWIHFDSQNPQYNRFENWGTPMDYK